jgi:hypothetical protein
MQKIMASIPPGSMDIKMMDGLGFPFPFPLSQWTAMELKGKQNNQPKTIT